MSSKKELLDEEDRLWRELCARFESVPETAWERPGATGDWTPKDVMAHVACWHAEATQQFERFHTTGDKPWWPDVDTFNAEAHEKCRDMTLHEVQAMSGAARHRFREEMARLEDPIHEKTERAIVGCGSRHYEEHLPELDAFLKSVGA
jgi:hypothetical protein